MNTAQRTHHTVALAMLLLGCSDHTLVGNIYKSPDTGSTTDIVEDTDGLSGTGDSSAGDTADDSGDDPVDTGPVEPERFEGTLNLDEGDWIARRVGGLAAFSQISLAAADLNGDGAAEVVVGAPGWLDPADHGAVYVSTGPMTDDGLLADEVRLEGDRIHYAGFTVDVGTPASAEYPRARHRLLHQRSRCLSGTRSHHRIGLLGEADGSIQYTSPEGTAAWAGRDVSATTTRHRYLVAEQRSSRSVGAAPSACMLSFTGRLDQNGIGLIAGPTAGSFDNAPHVSCHTATTDASGAPVVFAAAPGVNDSQGAIFRTSLSGTAADLPTELDDTAADDRVVGTAAGDMIGVFDDGWRCLLETGDINGDGVDDLVIGAPHYDRESGMAWVLDGAASWGGGSITDAPALMATVPGDLPDETETPDSCDGSCVGYGVELGDWDGDGAAELVVGRIRDFGAATLVWYGPVSGTLAPRTGEAGSPHVMVKGSGTEAKFADGDADGDMDLFVAEGTKQYDAAGNLLGQGGVWMPASRLAPVCTKKPSPQTVLLDMPPPPSRWATQSIVYAHDSHQDSVFSERPSTCPTLPAKSLAQSSSFRPSTKQRIFPASCPRFSRPSPAGESWSSTT